jgi:hypothetical protein
MTRREIEETVEPIIYESLRKFGEYARPGSSPEEYAEEIKSQLRGGIVLAHFSDAIPEQFWRLHQPVDTASHHAICPAC